MNGEAYLDSFSAGLLAEMHDDARACALLESTLVQIRRARRRDTDDFVALSMEGWALYLALAYSNRGLAHTPMLSKDMPQPFERWRALGIVDCDAFGDYRTLQQSLEANMPQQPEITKTRSVTWALAFRTEPPVPNGVFSGA